MIASFIVTIGLINCAIEHLEVKNKDNVTVFLVSEGQWIKVPNRHRSVPSSIRLTLSGVNIESVETKNSVLWILHLSDKTTIELKIAEKTNQTTEYYFNWHGGGPNESREVCVHYADNAVNWYSTYQRLTPKWPMDSKKKVPKQSFNYLLDYNIEFTNDTGEYYRVLEHLFVNSDGFALLLDEYQPWFMSRDVVHGDAFICFSVNNSTPYASNSNLDIKMHLVASKNIQTVTDYVVYESGFLPKPTALPDVNRIVHPSIYAQFNKQDEILKFANELTQKGLKHFELLDNDATWEKSRGDLSFDPVRYSNVENMIRQLATQGQRFRLEIYPIENNTHESTHKYFLRDNNGKLTNYLDLTREDACDWFEAELKKLRYQDELTFFHTYARNIKNVQMFNSTDPNLYIKNYISTVAKFANVISLSAFKAQHLPIYVQLVTHRMSDIPNLLRQLIPNALSISIAGYSFFSLNTIGFGGEISEEVYIRWLQAASLMPSMVFWEIPTRFSSNTLELTKTFINLHYDHAPLIIELAKRRIKYGSPIVRPMWYAEPDNPKTYKIDDQFMLGEDIVVAPVVAVGMRERTVYLPAGNWIDQHGKTYVGSNEFKVNAPLEELPYFKREII